MSTDELTFVRDEVQRLNTVLSKYQNKYPPLQTQGRVGGSADIPWGADRTLMAPLLAEYDATIDELTHSVGKDAFQSLRAQMQRLTAENERLRQELRESVEGQLSRAGPVDMMDRSTGGTIDAVTNLQQQLTNLQQEKNAVEDMWRTSTLEVERLEHSVQTARTHPTVQQIEVQAAQIKQQYIATVGELSAEISGLQEELHQKSGQLSTSQAQISKLRGTLEDLRMQMIQQEEDAKRAQEQSQTLVSGMKERASTEVTSMSRRLAEAQSRLDSLSHELEQSKRERGRAQQQAQEMQEKLAASESREYDAMTQVRDSVQMVEAAMLEKDQALLREKQTLECVEKLEGSMARLVDEAGARTRKEVDNVKLQANQSIQRLMDDLHTLEMDNTEKHTHVDRAIREKRAVESELEKLCQAGLISGNKESGNIDELTRRACHAERARDDALLRLDTVDNNLRRLERSSVQEKQRLQEELEQLKERLELMNTEYSAASEDRVQLVEQMDDMKKKMHTLQTERDSAVRTRTRELTCRESDFRLKEQEMEAKVQSLEDSHRHAMMDIRQMLNTQQRMSAKWKEECESVTQKFEHKLAELRGELSRERKRTQELTKLLRDSKTKTTEVEEMLAEYNHNIRRMEERVREAENRAATVHMQVGRQVRMESNPSRNIVEERRQLQRQLERSLAESRIGFSLSTPYQAEKPLFVALKTE